MERPPAAAKAPADSIRYPARSTFGLSLRVPARYLRPPIALLLVLPFTALAAGADRVLLFGDTHLHTSYSFDAFLNGNHSADPDVAYRWARGLPVVHPYNRSRVRIGTPLDFLVVSDHAEFLGGVRDIYNAGIQAPDPGPIDRLLYAFGAWRLRSTIDSGGGPDFFRGLLPRGDEDPRRAELLLDDFEPPPGADVSLANAWRHLTKIADANNDPGKFTALIGWEWSSNPGGANLHRVVVSNADAAHAARFQPFGFTDGPDPEDLWAWLEHTSAATGTRFVAIPHNANISKGLMFDSMTLRGEPMDAAYAETRRRWEPITEITQIKGDSETHPALSPDDAFADFERYEHYIQQLDETYVARRGDYVRPALETGLELEATIGVNPYRLGVIGSTDAHTGLSSSEEPNFWGKMAYDSVPEHKQGGALTRGATGWDMAAAGVAAVWADDNTRDGILDAFERREAYATTGPRIRLRVFGGWDFGDADLDGEGWIAAGYARGVPMGSELPTPPADADVAPTFLILAAADPKSGNLDRIQMVKGWLGGGGHAHERVFDVAWSGDRAIAADGTLPAVGDTVDRTRGTFSNDIGAAALEAVWQDPEFDAAQSAFYYVRVLEIPTPRHSLLDAIALGIEPPSDHPAVIQERAYGSAIWYRPGP